MILAKDIQVATKFVTKEWTRQRNAEERGRPRAYREYVYSDRVNFTDVASRILPGAYEKASGGGAYSVAQRQLYYASRAAFKEETGRELEYNYFTSALLRKYRNQNPDETASWRITADPRGTLIIPNARRTIRIPCGTLDIDKYLRQIAEEIDPLDVNASIAVEWPSVAPKHRYQAVMYIEKEGFAPLLQEARIAERFDLAILSCKGQSVVAARKYVDTGCAMAGGVPLFVVHDFDKAGFEISLRLTKVSTSAVLSDRVTYEFRNAINVTDFGLRLDDVEKYGLESEACEFKGGFTRDSICTEAEKKYLRSGRRVELNAFTSPQFIEWLEAKLTEQGLGERLVPSDVVLEAAYRRAMIVSNVNVMIEEIFDDVVEEAKNAKVPKTLRRKLLAAMKNQDDELDQPWDKVLYQMVNEKVKNTSLGCE